MSDIASASSEFRIVLVGKTGSGKSSTGNTILDRKLFKEASSPESVTKTCQRNMDDGIKIIDTPGLFDTTMSIQKMKEEIVKCVEMSVPGPHVFLLVIRLGVRFTDEEKNTVKWIQENFGEESAHYTIVLFTHADALDQSLDEYISESNDLKALVDECSGKVHSFNNKNMENRDQVTELLKKIGKMVKENGRKHYTNEMYQEAQRRILDREKFWSGKPRIVLLGKSGSGKSSAGNTIMGQSSFKRSYLTNSATKSYELQEACMAGKSMKIINTSGLIDAPEKKMKTELERFVIMSSPGPHVFLLVIRLDMRVTDEEKNILKWIQDNFGEKAFCHTIVLFTHTDHLKGGSLDEYIKDTPDLQAFTESLGGRFHSFNNKDVENRSQVSELMEKIEKMVERNGWRYYTMEMYQDAQQKKQFWSEKPRIVLLGKTGSGKTSAVETIVGRESLERRNSPDSPTKTCELHKAHVAGKSMKIIDTPGLIDAPEKKMKSELEKCVEMMAPGPHVFLLVIRLDKRITDEEKNIEQWIQENFGDEAAQHTIILFTHTDSLDGKPFELYISESDDLKALVFKWGGRFHSFNIKGVENRSQVTELMEKIEKMVERNGWRYYTSQMYQDAQQKKQFWSEKPRIVLLGKTGSGKTSAVETIVGRESLERRNSPDSLTKTCELHKAHVAGKSMKIIDTPGLIEAPKRKMKSELEKCVEMMAPGPHVFLLVIRLDKRITDEEKNTVQWIQKNFGEEAARHTIVLFTHADSLDGKLFDLYISKSDDLKDVVNECGGRFILFCIKDRENHSQVTELLEKIEKLVKENGGKHYTNEMYQEAQRKILDREKFWFGKPRIVLLGKTKSGKSSARNTIMGQGCFKGRNSTDSTTKTCKIHKACVAGKSMKIIDTPGLIDAPEEKIKAEIANCVHMSAPGPHVFLLVIRLDVRFTEKEKNTVKWIQKNFGQEAARFTIVLFTHSDHLRGKPINEYICENNDLQAVVNDCGGRFHSFNNEDLRNHNQVTELLEKIDEMVKNNKGKHHKKAQWNLQFWSGNLRIVLLGKTGSGKTSVVETIVGRESFTKTCELQEACVDGKSMKIIDTPGLIDVPEEKTKEEVEKLVFKSDPGPHVFLLVIRLDKRITDEEENTVKWIQENFGKEAAQFTIVLFTHTDHLNGRSLDEYIRDTPDLQAFTESLGGRFHSFNNKDVENRSQVTELMEKIEKMVERNGWRYYTSEILQTILKNDLYKQRNIGAKVGAAGAGAAVVAGGVVLGAAEIAVVPALVIAGGGVALAGAAAAGGMAIYKKITKKD